MSVFCSIRDMFYTGNVIEPKRLWSFILALALFAWIMSAELEDTLALDQQTQQAILVWFLTGITLSSATVVLMKYIQLKKIPDQQTKSKIHFHLRLFYNIFAILIVLMQMYWIMFKIIFHQCDYIVSVDFTLSSGSALYSGQIAHALASGIFAAVLSIWLSLQQKFSKEKYNKGIHHMLMLTLFAKTCYTYLDEARLMVDYVTHAGYCQYNNSHSSEGRDIVLNCTALQNSDNLNLYVLLYEFHIQLLEPLEYAASSEGLTTFLAVLVLLKGELQDNSDHDNGHNAPIAWKNVLKCVIQQISLYKKVAIGCAICVSWCLSIGIFVVFVQLFVIDNKHIGSHWSDYLFIRITIFTMLIIATTTARATQCKHNPSGADNVTSATERLDIKMLFYSMVMGMIPLFLFSFIAAVVPWITNSDCSGNNQYDVTQTFESATNFVQAISQYIFIASAIEFKTCKNLTSSSWIEAGVLLMLIVFQLIMWIVNIGSKHIIAKINITGRDYYPDAFWAVAMAVIYPSAVFFRAHAFILCGTLLFDYSRTFSDCYIPIDDEQPIMDIENDTTEVENVTENSVDNSWSY